MTAWNAVSNAAFAGPVSAVGAGVQLQNGWTDIAGGVWSINSSNLATEGTAATAGFPPNVSALLRPQAEDTVDVKIRATYVCPTAGQIYLIARHNRSTSSNCYAGVCAGNIINIYSCVGGVYTKISTNTTAGGSLSAGTTYVAEFIVSGTNPTTCAFTLYASDGATVIFSTITATDATSVLQVAGSAGFAGYYVQGSGCVSIATTYTDVVTAATTYSLTGPTSGLVGSLAGLFTITPNGTLASAVTFTASDASHSGTFSNSGTISVAAGSSPSGTFTYTPAVAGTFAISTTNSGSLTNPSGVTFTSSSNVTWYSASSTTFSGGAKSAGSAGSVLQNGWTDVVGSIWSITSANLVAAVSGSTVTSGALLRPTSENAINAKIVAEVTNYNMQPFLVARHNRLFSTTTTNCYAVAWPQTSLVFYAYVNGVATQLHSAFTTGVPSLGSNTYYLELDVVQAGSGTNLTATIYSSGGVSAANILCTFTILGDTTSALQNYSGGIGLASYGSVGGEYIGASTYTTIPPVATAFALSGPSSGQVSVPVTLTVTPNGSTPASSTNVVLTDGGAGGTFSNSGTLTFSASALTSQTLTYTAASVGTEAITMSNTGSLANTGSPLSFASIAAPSIIGVTSVAWLFSPGNWYGDGGGTPARTGSAWRQSWNNGASASVTWTTGASSPSATLLLGSNYTSASTESAIALFLNGVPTANSPVKLTASGGSVSIPGLAVSTTYTLTVLLKCSDQSSRWSSTAAVNVVRLTGLQIDGASSAGTAASPRPWGMIVGDSISEGIQSNAGNDDFTQSYSYFLTQAMDKAGYDVCVSACGYSGWLHTGDYTADVPGYCSVSGGVYSETSSRLDKISSGVSLLDRNGQISSYGAVNTQPSFILINYGVNDAIYNQSISDFPISIVKGLTLLRAAAPQAVIALLMPFGYYTNSLVAALGGTTNVSTWQSSYRTAFANYQSANPGDINTVLIDLGQSVSNTVFNSPGWYNSNVHPLLLGSAYIAPRVAGQLCQALKTLAIPQRSYPFARL